MFLLLTLSGKQIHFTFSKFLDIAFDFLFIFSYSMITNFIFIQQCFLLQKLISSHLIIPSLVLNTAQSNANAKI